MNKDLLAKKIEEFYNNMSDVELRDRLTSSGFKILDDQPGKVIIKDDDFEDSKEFNLPITTKVSKNKRSKYRLNYRIEKNWEVNDSLLRNVG